MDSVISSTSYLTSSTVGGKIQLQLANNYVQLIQQKLGDATKWLVVQEMCTAIVCDGRETAEIFGFRGVISVNDNSGIEGEVTSLVYEIHKNNDPLQLILCWWLLTAHITLEGYQLLQLMVSPMNIITFTTACRSVMFMCKLHSLW